MVQSVLDTLPTALLNRLKELAHEMAASRPDPMTVRAVVDGLAMLPPDEAARIGGCLWRIDGLMGDKWRPMQSAPTGLLGRWFSRFQKPPPPTARERNLARLQETPGLEYVFLFHWDGHVREAALDQLTDAPGAFFVIAIAVRLNDWAPQVRKAAMACAARILGNAPASAIADAAMVILPRRWTWRRGSDELGHIDEHIGRTEVLDDLIGRVIAAPAGKAMRVFNELARYPYVDAYLPQVATQARQPAVRAMAFRFLIDGIVQWRTGYRFVWIDKAYGHKRRVPAFGQRPLHPTLEPADVISEAAKDRAAPVRIMAADALIRLRHKIPAARALAESMQNDRSPGVRQRAAFILSQPDSHWIEPPRPA